MSAIVRLFGVSRVVLGLWLMATPASTGRMRFGESEQSGPVQVLVRRVGSRDVAQGAALAADTAHPARWLAATCSPT